MTTHAVSMTEDAAGLRRGLLCVGKSLVRKPPRTLWPPSTPCVHWSTNLSCPLVKRPWTSPTWNNSTGSSVTSPHPPKVSNRHLWRMDNGSLNFQLTTPDQTLHAPFGASASNDPQATRKNRLLSRAWGTWGEVVQRRRIHERLPSKASEPALQGQTDDLEAALTT